MCFSVTQIAGMLAEYESDHGTGMDIQAAAEEISRYTSGYPVLVSSICKYIDEILPKRNDSVDSGNVWTAAGIEEAVKYILSDRTPLFESMIRHLDDYPDMKRILHAILFRGVSFAYNLDVKEISFAGMFGYIVNKDGRVQIANRIFETRLYNYFLSETDLHNPIGSMAKRDKSFFVHDGRLDMDVVMRRFVEAFTDIYGGENWKFVEEYGRKFFLLYLKPIINGIGNYYVEAQTREEDGRML